MTINKFDLQTPLFTFRSSHPKGHSALNTPPLKWWKTFSALAFSTLTSIPLTTIFSYYEGRYYMFEILRPNRSYYFDNIVTPSAARQKGKLGMK